MKHDDIHDLEADEAHPKPDNDLLWNVVDWALFFVLVVLLFLAGTGGLK